MGVKNTGFEKYLSFFTHSPFHHHFRPHSVSTYLNCDCCGKNMISDSVLEEHIEFHSKTLQRETSPFFSFSSCQKFYILREIFNLQGKGGRGFGAKKRRPEVGSKKLKSFGRRMPSLIVTELYFQNSQEIFIFLHEIEENFACFPFFLEP